MTINGLDRNKDNDKDNQMGLKLIKYDILICRSCHMMIIIQSLLPDNIRNFCDVFTLARKFDTHDVTSVTDKY